LALKEDDAMTLTGGCACGQVRYQITNEPLFTHACHCSDCQRSTGSAFVIHSICARDDLKISGETRAANLPTDSGAGCELHFCTTCGTYIWGRYHYNPAPVIAVRCGTLDDPGQVSPRAHIFTRSKQPWLSLPDDVPATDGALDRETVWPAESVQRYKSLLPEA
jgi:hypothetical protein